MPQYNSSAQLTVIGHLRGPAKERGSLNPVGLIRRGRRDGLDTVEHLPDRQLGHRPRR